MGWTIRPLPLKKRDTSSPRSARRSIASAETGLADLRVFFIQSDLLLGRSPQCDEMQDLALFVFPGFEYDDHPPSQWPETAPERRIADRANKAGRTTPSPPRTRSRAWDSP